MKGERDGKFGRNGRDEFGRNIKLRMHFANEITPNSSESPSFRIPSN